jgi:hypothetical protein
MRPNPRQDPRRSGAGHPRGLSAGQLGPMGRPAWRSQRCVGGSAAAGAVVR